MHKNMNNKVSSTNRNLKKKSNIELFDNVSTQFFSTSAKPNIVIEFEIMLIGLIK